jgi:dihydropteroate synthase type 2
MESLTHPKIVGIVNVTEDSFSDGGRYLAPEAALAHARRLGADGADILDIGAAASNPNAKAVSPDEEIRRLEPLVRTLIDDGQQVSIDSFASATQTWALAQGVHYLNDIHGFADPAIYPQLAAAKARLIVMYMVGEGIAIREKGDAASIWERILTFFEDRIAALEAAGIERSRLVLDPGMGLFLGAGREVSLAVLRDLPRLKGAFGLPVLVSVSRKSFLRAITGRDPGEAGAATLAAELWAADHGADFIRTHDVRALKDALTIRAALAGPGGEGQA